MTPPRPTVHQLKSLDAKFLKVIEHINKLTHGDTLAGDHQKLEKLREYRHVTEDVRRSLGHMIERQS